jgi:hypothetical protein
VILAEAAQEVRRLSGLLDAGLEMLRTSAEDVASAEQAYRKARAKAWVENTVGTAGFREAQVDGETASLRYKRDVAEGMRRAALESVRARSTQISMIQTLLNAHRAEASISARGPDSYQENSHVRRFES